MGVEPADGATADTATEAGREREEAAPERKQREGVIYEGV